MSIKNTCLDKYINENNKFYLNKIMIDAEHDIKQHLNLSEYAWSVIEVDRMNFAYNEEEISLSFFINEIFTNFYKDSRASINIRCQVEANRIRKISKNISEDVVDYLVDNYKQQLLAEVKSYPKGMGKKVRINVYNTNLFLNEIYESDNYNGYIGPYIKAIIEEYVRFPSSKRESIFFKKTIDSINVSLLNNRKLILTLKGKYNNRTKLHEKKRYLLSPYDLVKDNLDIFNYLIGYSQEVKGYETFSNPQMVSYRLSRIIDVEDTNYTNDLSKNDIKDITDAIRDKGPQYMVGDIIDIKVRFSKYGYDLFNRILYMRPNYFDKVENEDLTFVFHCTSRHFINYFFKLGSGIEVLEPIDLRQQFMRDYAYALKKYQNDEDYELTFNKILNK